MTDQFHLPLAKAPRAIRLVLSPSNNTKIEVFFKAWLDEGNVPFNYNAMVKQFANSQELPFLFNTGHLKRLLDRLGHGKRRTKKAAPVPSEEESHRAIPTGEVQLAAAHITAMRRSLDAAVLQIQTDMTARLDAIERILTMPT